MAHGRRTVSFVMQGVKWRDERENGDGDGLLVVQPQSVFSRLGPRVSVDVRDPPYVPESVGEPPLPGMIFGCTPETYHECLSRQLFGLPVYPHKPQVMRIAPGASIFLFDFHTKYMYGIFEATSHGGVHIVREAFGGKYDAQVKVRLVENCPYLHEREFKDAIRENYRDAKKFNFYLSEAQVCSLKFLFRRKAVEVCSLSIEQNRGRRVVQYCPVGPQQARNSIQVISSIPKDEVEVSRTFLISAPPLLPRVHASPSHTRSRALGGLEVSICAKDKKDKKRNGISDSPGRHVVMYETRKEQFIPPVLKSKIIKSDRQEVVEGVSRSPPSKGISQDRKRRADASGVQLHGKGQLVLQEQGQEIDEGGSGKHYGDFRELLNQPRLKKKSRPSTKESVIKLVSTPMDPPAYAGGNIAIGEVVFHDDSKRNLERVLPPPSKKHRTITSGSLKAEFSKDLVICRTSKKADSTEETSKSGKTVRPVQDLQRKLKSAPVSDDDIVQFLTAAGSHCAKANNVEGRGVIEASRSENRYNNEDVELKTANCDAVGVGGCVDLSTDLPVKSGVMQKLDDEIMESGPGDESKDGRLDIYVSLNVEMAENARQSNSPLGLENYQATGHVVNCVLGKRTRGSKQDGTVLGSAMEPQSLHTETPVKKRKERPKESHIEDSISEVLLTAANVSDTLQEREQRDYLPAVPLAGDQYLTSQVHARNACPCIESLSEEGTPAPTNILQLNAVIPVASTVIPNNTGDMRSLDCKTHRAEKENVPSSPIHKLNKIEDNETGCSCVITDVSMPREGSDLPGKVLQKYETFTQNSAHSLFSGKSGNLWNCRTLRYGKHRNLDTLANHGSRRSSKSGSEPTSTLGKSDPNAGSTKIGEEIVYNGGENYDRQPVSPNTTEAFITRERLENQGALLVCELGNPGGLSLDRKMIRVDTQSDILREHQPSAVGSVVQQCMLPTEIDLPSRSERFQTVNAALIPRSEGLESLELRKKISTMKGLAEKKSEVSDKNCHPDDIPSLESVQPTFIASNEGRAHPSLPSCKERMPLKLEPKPRRADASQAARDPSVEDWLYARNRGSPSACTSTASLFDCSGPVGEPELEINIPIKEEELEIRLPIEDDEEVHAGPQNQTGRLWGSSNADIKPSKLLQKTPFHNT